MGHTPHIYIVRAHQRPADSIPNKRQNEQCFVCAHEKDCFVLETFDMRMEKTDLAYTIALNAFIDLEIVS